MGIIEIHNSHPNLCSTASANRYGMQWDQQFVL